MREGIHLESRARDDVDAIVHDASCMSIAIGGGRWIVACTPSCAVADHADIVVCALSCAIDHSHVRRVAPPLSAGMWPLRYRLAHGPSATELPRVLRTGDRDLDDVHTGRCENAATRQETAGNDIVRDVDDAGGA